MNHNQAPITEKNAETLSFLEQNLEGSGNFKSGVRNIDLHNVLPLELGENSKTGVEASLVAVIKAGQELFGVAAVRKEANSDSTTFALTRIREGKRGQLVDVMKPGTTPSINDIGRTSFNDNQDPLDEATSRNHFSVEFNERGEIVVTDNGSTNGTEIFARFKTTLDADKPLPDGPLANGSWLPRSAELKEFA